MNREEDFGALATELGSRWGGVDGVLHAVAFAPPDALGGGFLETPPESAEVAFRTSAYSFKALASSLAPLMSSGGSVVGLTFDAAVAWPVYDWMGVSKAALESVSRYLARDLGPRGVRVNLVAAGPVSTPAAGGIPGFERLSALWGVAGAARLGSRRIRRRWPTRCASCSPTCRGGWTPRSSTWTAASTRWARRSKLEERPAPTASCRPVCLEPKPPWSPNRLAAGRGYGPTIGNGSGLLDEVKESSHRRPGGSASVLPR